MPAARLTSRRVADGGECKDGEKVLLGCRCTKPWKPGRVGGNEPKPRHRKSFESPILPLSTI